MSSDGVNGQSQIIQNLTDELHNKQQEFQDLKLTYEDFVKSSKEFEEEMEAELQEAEQALKSLRESNEQLQSQLETYQNKYLAVTATLNATERSLQLRTAELAQSTTRERALEVQLEQALEESRRAAAEASTLRTWVERMEEEKAFVCTDLEDLKQEWQVKEERQRQQINELQEEVIALTPMKEVRQRLSSSFATPQPLEHKISVQVNCTDFDENMKLSKENEALRKQLLDAFDRIQDLVADLEAIHGAGFPVPKKNEEMCCTMLLNGKNAPCSIM